MGLLGAGSLVDLGHEIVVKNSSADGLGPEIFDKNSSADCLGHEIVDKNNSADGLGHEIVDKNSSADGLGHEIVDKKSSADGLGHLASKIRIFSRENKCSKLHVVRVFGHLFWFKVSSRMCLGCCYVRAGGT